MGADLTCYRLPSAPAGPVVSAATALDEKKLLASRGYGAITFETGEATVSVAQSKMPCTADSGRDPSVAPSNVVWIAKSASDARGPMRPHDIRA